MAFQDSAFQATAFQLGTQITSTTRLQLPVDYQLAGYPLYREVIRGHDIRPRNERSQVVVKRGGVARLSGSGASFKVNTSGRGYE